MTPWNPKAQRRPALAIRPEFTPNIGVIHYTAGTTLAGAVATLVGVGNTIHFIIDRDGTLVQCVPTNMRAQHCGPSWYDGRSSLNLYALGIELVNPGFVRPGFLPRAGWPVLKMRHRSEHIEREWFAYTERQLDTLCDLITWTGIQEWAGHDHICNPVGRKLDPGPAFPWERVRALGVTCPTE